MIVTLKAAYVQGRLSKDEFEQRVSQAFGSRTWAELDALTSDIPVFADVAPASSRSRRWSQAILVCVAAIASLGLILFGLLAALSPTRPVISASSTPTRSTIAGAEGRIQCGALRGHPGGRLSRGFVAEAAVECAPSTISFAFVPQGHLLIIKRVADRGLVPLLAALRRQSRPLYDGACPMPTTPVPVLFLIGREGQIIRPAIPTGVCGLPLQQVLTAVQLTPWVTVRTTLVQVAGQS